jgi:sugar phosphate isomerase/epimerase
MRIGINQWTTFPAPFEHELAAYRAAGAEAIGILEFKLDGVDDVRGKLRESGLAVSACLPAAGSILPSPLIPGPEEPEARVESICASVARFAELEPSCVFFLTGPGDDRATVVEGIRRIGVAGSRQGVRVGAAGRGDCPPGSLGDGGAVRSLAFGSLPPHRPEAGL